MTVGGEAPEAPAGAGQAPDRPRFALTGRVAAVFAVLSFLVLALVELRLPGLYYDEVLFVNAALGGLDDAFLHVKWFGVPVAVMSYIGALKSWLHAPIFWVLGVSVETIRVPSILFCCVTLVIAWRLGVRLFGHALAAALVVVLATDPAFVLQARMDWGPTVLMLLFKLLAVWSCMRWLVSPSLLWLWVTVGALSLGLFDKLNFVWFVVAMGFAVPAVWPRELFRGIGSGSRWRFLPLGLFALVLGMAAAHSLRLMLQVDPYVELPEGMSLTERVPRMLGLWTDTATGSAYHRFVFAEPIPSPSWIVLVPIVGALAMVCVRLRRGTAERDGRPLASRADVFFLLLLALLFVQMVATPQARGGHHALMAWPFHHLFAFAAIAGLRTNRTTSVCRAVPWVAGVAGVLLVVSQLAATGSFLARLNDTGAYRAVWSPAIYDLAKAMDGDGERVILSVDWGLHNQLFALASPSRRLAYDDLWQAFDDLERGRVDEDRVFERWFRGRDATVVLFAPGEAARESARETFVRFARDRLQAVGEPELLKDASGRPLYEIHHVRG